MLGGTWIDADENIRLFYSEIGVGFSPDLAFIVGAHSMCDVIETDQ